MYMYLGFAKAVDTVPHQPLLAKMVEYGITGRILKWTESFLFNRQQHARLGSDFSNRVGVQCMIVALWSLMCDGAVVVSASKYYILIGI